MAVKITTGQIAQARLNITSIAAGIVTGTFANTQIPKTLDNTWIPSAVWPIAQIPTVDSKITSVDGSKILSGNIDNARIPGMDAVESVCVRRLQSCYRSFL